MKTLLVILALCAVSVSGQSKDPLQMLDEIIADPLGINVKGQPPIKPIAFTRGFVCHQKIPRPIEVPSKIKDSVIVFYSTFHAEHYIAGFWTNGFALDEKECAKNDWAAFTGRKDVTCACLPH